MENRRFLKCRTFLKVPSPLSFEDPRPRELKNFSPVSELALNLSGLSTGHTTSNEASPYGTPKRCIRVIQSQKTTNSTKAQLFRPRALKKPLCGTILDLIDSSANSPIINQSTLEKAKSPQEANQRKKRSSAFTKLKQLSPVCSMGDFEASSPCITGHGLGEEAYSPEINSQDPLEDTPIARHPLPKLDMSLTPCHASQISKPSPDVDETSQDSGVHTDSGFKYPTEAALRPGSLCSKEELSFSPSTFMSSPITPTSPHALSFSSPSPDLEVDDGFHELDDTNVPAGMAQLLHGKIIKEEKHNAPSLSSLPPPDFTTPHRSSVVTKKKPTKRPLFRSSSVANVLPSAVLDDKVVRVQKRLQKEDDCAARPSLKRRKSTLSFLEENQENKNPRKPTLQRCQSDMEMVKTSLDHAVTNGEVLIGDHSKPHCLPMTCSKHQDLKCITPHTMADLLDGKYDDVVSNYVIVDCRYPYEFHGGHIERAVNYYTKLDIYEKFIQKDLHRQPQESNKRNIIIFHCEFSSERGPKMYRFLRNKDRDANNDSYPVLHYPELYLLEGGYKCFWEQHKDKCTLDGAYKPMLHKDHNEEMKFFRAKSKTWPGDRPSLSENTDKKSRPALKSLFY